jgi:hypothetical protein
MLKIEGNRVHFRTYRDTSHRWSVGFVLGDGMQAHGIMLGYNRIEWQRPYEYRRKKEKPEIGGARPDPPAVPMSEMPRMTVEEWRAEAIRRFGSFEKTRFVCPACGHVASVEDFKKYKDLGAQPDSAAQKCIGRYDQAVTDCDWAAFGLFGTLNGGVKVILEDGKEVNAFDFAEATT